MRQKKSSNLVVNIPKEHRNKKRKKIRHNGCFGHFWYPQKALLKCSRSVPEEECSMNIPVRFGVISHILSSEYKTPLPHPHPDSRGTNCGDGEKSLLQSRSKINKKKINR